MNNIPTSLIRKIDSYYVVLLRRFPIVDRLSHILKIKKNIWIASLLLSRNKINNVYKKTSIFIRDCLQMTPKNISSITHEMHNGLKLQVRANTLDTSTLYETTVLKQYDWGLTQLNDTATVIDIGAHIGSFSLLAAYGHPKRRIIAVEPETDNFRMVQQNIKINKLKNVTVIQNALSSKKGFLDLHVARDSTVGHSSFMSKPGDSTQRISTLSFSDLIKKYNLKKIDLLKIDCEGCEYDCLFLADDMLFRNVERMIIEFHSLDSTHNEKTLSTFLEKKGFTVVITPYPDNIIMAFK